MVQLVENGLAISGLNSERPANGEPGQRFFDISSGSYSIYDGNQWVQVSNSSGARFQLDWIAGADGKPGVNGDFVSATEALNTKADRHFEIQGTAGTSVLCTYDAEGGLKLTTGATDGNGMHLAPHLDADLTPWTEVTWGTDQEVSWKCSFVTGASIATEIIWAGLKLTSTDVTATDDDQVFVRYENGENSGAWTVNSAVGGTETNTNTTDTVAVSTVYNIEITFDSSRIARTYINGVLQQTSSALDVADLIPYICIELDGASSARNFTIRGQSISRNFA